MMKRRSALASLIAITGVRPSTAKQDERLPALSPKPVVFAEGHYDGGWGPQPHDLTTRKQAYWAVLSGAAGHAYGADAMYGWADPQWGVSLQTAMSYASAAQMKHVSDLFTSRAWQLLVPDLNGSVMTAGAGDGVDYAATARASDGSLIIAYIPSRRTVTIDMTRMVGPVTARWVDPTNGTHTGILLQASESTGRAFSTPGKNARGHGDWILVLETAGANKTVAAGPARFPLRVSANGRHLIDNDAKPFFYQADTPWWMAWRGQPPDIKAYLDNRRARGFNTLQIMLLPAGTAPAGNVVNSSNINGDRPFSRNQVLDVGSVNEAYMRHVDRVFRQATDAGFYLVLAPAWFGSKGEDYERFITEKNAAAWGGYLAKRYGKYQNIAWIMAGDSNAEGKANAVGSMARAFKAIAPHQLLTAHAEVQSSSRQYHTESWLDFNMAYDYTWGGGWVYPQIQRDFMGR